MGPESNHAAGNFHAVGIGASAGGLEALKQLLPSLPDNENIVYIVCQHMDPRHDSMLSSLLSGSTTMPVVQIENNQQIVPDTVFIAPPGHDVLVDESNFKLHGRRQPVGPKPSVDRLLTSLAEQHKERAAGFILSGTGSDGALGMRAIKAHGGLTIAQSPDTAKYGGMPRSAISTGSVDLVLDAPKIGGELGAILQNPVLASTDPVEKQAPDDLARLMGLMKKHLGHDFSEYKENTVLRRINRRLAVHKLSSLGEYIEYAERNPKDLEGLVKDILISVTEFFRDKEAFEKLRGSIGELIDSKSPGAPIRIWVPGCSSGEEVYSIAFLFKQVSHERGKPSTLQIYATDIDGDMVKLARSGIYSEASLVHIDKQMKDRCFNSDEGQYRVNKSIREQVVFAQHNIIDDPPFSHIDLIACRNLLIYFSTALQNRLMTTFHYSLNPGGVLFLGKSESIGVHNDLFAPIHKKWRIFRRLDTGRTTPAAFHRNLSSHKAPEPINKAARKSKAPSHQDIMDRAVSSVFGPPSVLVNDQLQLLYAKGDCKRYFEITEGNIGPDIFDLVRRELKAPLRTVLAKAIRENTSVFSLKNRLPVSEDAVRYVDIHAHAGDQEAIPQGYILISFIEHEQESPAGDMADAAGGQMEKRLVELEQELAASHERLQSSMEELETSSEEMQSMNEELQSANEELQATNEELETSNEELQATNEELATVNQEMLVRGSELSEANADLENVFKRMGIPLMVLDTDLRIRRYTPALDQVFDFMPGDRGQLVTNIGTSLVITDFKKRLEDVLSTGASHREIVRGPGMFYEMRVYPYHDEQNAINGLLVSFYDITLASQREQEFRALAENAPDVVTRFDRELRYLYLNEIIERYSDRKRKDFLGKTNREMGLPDELCALWDREVAKVLETGVDASFEFESLTPEGRVHFATRVVPERAPDGTIVSAMAISRDITSLKRSEQAYKNTVESIADGFMVLDENLRVEYFNDAAGKMLGRTADEVLGLPLFDSFPEARGSVFEEKYRQVLATGEKAGFETWFDTPPYENWYKVSVYPRDGSISVYFQITTPQKTAQLETARQRELFQAILDHIPVHIVLYDAKIQTLHVNKEFQKKTGWTEAEIEQGDIMEMCYPDPEYREQVAAYMEEPSTEWREFSMQTKGGTSLDMIWSNVNLSSGSRIGIGIDISDKKQLEQLLRRRAKLEALGTLAGGIAHDFNNCLAAILGYADLALELNREQADCRDEIEEVITASKTARDLVKQILTFSQNTAVKKTPVNVIRTVSDVVRMLSSTVPSYIRIEPELTTEPVVVMADATQIHQVIMNLCTNAVDAMRGDDGILRISVQRIRKEDTGDKTNSRIESETLLQLSIADTGTGIEPEMVDRLFDPYFSTKGPRYGSGLGLAMVEGIVTNLGGEITVESTVGQGSEFTVFLPALSAADANKVSLPGEIHETATDSSGSERILVLDDDQALCRVLTRLLKRMGYTATSYIDPKAALEAFKKNPGDFDLVITDMTMPGMTGDRFGRAVKELAPDIPVIMCTGYSEQYIPRNIEEIGIDAVLLKPVDHRELSAAIRQAFENRPPG